MSSLAISLLIAALLGGFLVFNYMRMKRIKPVPDHENIIILTDANFQHQTKKGLFLVDFWAAWCGPCKVMAPILNELAEASGGSFTVGKLNVDEQAKTATIHAVRNIPTMILFRDGKEIKRFVGVKPKSYLLKQLSELKKSYA